MRDVSDRLASLSPAKRALLTRLQQTVTTTPPKQERIPRRSSRDAPQLSFAQQRLWFLDQLEGPSSVYNMPNAVRLDGPLDRMALQAVFQEIVKRHEALRTNFTQQSSHPVQVIHPDIECDLPLVDLHAQAEAERESTLRDLAEAEARRPFDLSADQLLRLKLVRLAPDRHVLLINLHHIVSDGWSIGNVLLHEVMALYAAFSQGRPSPLPALPIQYADYSCWQREWLSGPRLTDQLGYWQDKLSDIPALLALPTDRPRPPVQTFAGDTHYFTIQRSLTDGLRLLGQSCGTTLFMTLLAGFGALLARYSGQQTVVVGSPIANRRNEALERLIGFFVNTLALRMDFTDDLTGRDLLDQVRRTCLDAYRHQDVPFERLVEAIQPERNLSFSPLFQCMFILQNQNAPTSDLRIGDLRMTAIPQNAAASMFSLTLKLEETDQGLSGELEYNTDLFDAATIERFVSRYRTLLSGLAATPDCLLAQLPLLDTAERQQMLVDWNATRRTYPREQLVHELFAEQARRHPDRTALVHEGTCVTYGALAKRAEQLARYLLSLQLGPENLIGLCVDRSIEMVVGLLGILQAGAAYVPLDPAYPAERLAYMVAHSRLSLLLLHETTTEILPGAAIPRVYLDRDWPAIASAPPRPAVPVHPDGLAYVIYTSGSTGIPKGVQIPHAALRNFLLTMSEQPGLAANDVLLAVTTISFDIAALELYLPLINGAQVALVSRDAATDGFALRRILEETAATVMQATPATWRLLLAADWHGPLLQRIFCGGEALPGDLADQLLAATTEVWNLYGPTETTIWSTAARVCRTVSAPANVATELIGRPIGNTQVYVLDPYIQPVPIGLPGELFIGGAGLSRGYRSQPAMTAERFLPDPFAITPGSRVYRTGDLTRFLDDGRLAFMGRLDHQVKVRGFRIELGEIETLLNQHPAVRNAVVVSRQDQPNNQQLVAYLEFASDWKGNPTDVEALDTLQIEKWQAVWDDSYRATTPTAMDSLDTSGWLSSYTGRPIPDAEMQEWVDHTVARVLALRPTRVLEIGCGTGLLLLRIAPHAQQYVGIDFSASVLTALRARVERLGLIGVQLLRREALEFDAIHRQAFDTVILNSVVQYFSGIDYLLAVLESAIDAVADGGSIFLGDLRSLPLLELQHASVQFHQAADDCSREELSRRVASQVEHEEELLLHPSLFSTLQRRFPRISQITLLLKRGQSANEMTKFRYDVVLRIGHLPSLQLDYTNAPCIDTMHDLSWHELQANVTRQLAAEPDLLLVRNLPNRRVVDDVRVLQWLSDGSTPRTVGEMRTQLLKEPGAGIDPEMLLALGESLGYSVGFGWSAGEPQRCFDAVFYRHDMPDDCIGLPALDEAPDERYANDPVQAARTRTLVTGLRHRLASRLPDYMLPAAIVCLEQLPLTPNGKIDRRALPAPAALGSERQYAAPRNANEEQLAAIWTAVLGVEHVGIDDNFFGLGGHSLLAVQVISRIREAFAIDLPIRLLFDAPTIRALAERMFTGGAYTRPTLPPIPVLSPEERQAAPLSFAQQRLWFLDRLEGTSVAYHISGAVRITGPLNVAVLEQVMTEILRRHDSLRTTFQGHDGQPVQSIAPAAPCSLSLVPLDSLSPSAQGVELQSRLASESGRPFDLAHDSLFRAMLLRLADNTHVLIVTLHHIVSDQWSVGLIFQEVAALYRAFSNGQSSPLPELAIQYADYAKWQRGWLNGPVLQSQLQYWVGELEGAPPVLDLPIDRPRPQSQSYRGHTQSFTLDAILLSRIKQLGQASQATLFMTLLAGFGVLLARISRTTDLVIGSPIANRNQAELEAVIGFFVNTLPLRLDVSGHPSARELLARARRAALAAYDHQDVPLEQIVDALQPERSLSYAPIFQVMFVLQNAPMPDMELGDLRLETVDPQSVAAKFDLTLLVEERRGELHGSFEYSTDLFDDSTISRLIGQFDRVLQGMVATPDADVMALPLLSDTETKQILRHWNETAVPLRHRQAVHVLFELQAEQTPDRPALACDEAILTFAALNREANRVAHQLRALGVGPDVLVALCVEPSFDMLIGLLAILKAGGGYVPLMPRTPPNRLAFILEETKVSMVLTQEALRNDLPVTRAQILCIDALRRGIAADTNLHSPPHPESLAYVIYTSGSTGQPKGVQVTHGNLLHSISARLSHYNAPFGGLLLLQPLVFDVATGGIFWTLCQGGCLYLEPHDVAQDPKRLLARIEQSRVSHLILVPLAYTALLDLAEAGQMAPLRLVIVGGEQLPTELAAKHHAKVSHAALFNEYGPTEVTVWSSVFKCEPGDTRGVIPIGRATPQCRLYCLDVLLNPVPIGVAGELYIGGPQVSRGYLSHTDLTAEKFIPDAFAAEPGDRLYRTGDLVRYHQDGNIEFLGRNDQQVKIRGFRIEPGEIAATIATHPDVRDAVVIASEPSGRKTGSKRLVAYIVAAENAAPESREIRNYLKLRLPDYMVPSAFVLLDALPLTPNGKLDRRALPVPDRESREFAYVAARTPKEALLTTIWQGVLGLDQVGVHDNFFSLGGDSILSIQIASRANRAGFGISVKQLFQHQTIAELARIVPDQSMIRAEQAMLGGPVVVTPAYAWFVDQLPPEPWYFNQSVLLDMAPGIDPTHVEHAVQHLIDHHDMLRARFHWHDEGGNHAENLRITIMDSRETTPFSVFDYAALAASEKPAAIRAEADRQQKSLSLSDGPILRASLFQMRDGHADRLLLVIHHFVVDGVSWRILLDDLATALNQMRLGLPVVLPAKTTSFQYWSRQLQAYARSPQATAELDYWRGQISAPSALLPVEPSAKVEDNTLASADHVTLSMTADVTQGLLQHVPQAYRTQINDVLLTALIRTLARWTHDSSFRLLLEGHGREELFHDVDLSRTVGWFTAAFPVVLQCEEGERPETSLKRVKEILRGIPKHGIGYGLFRYLSPETTVRAALESAAEPEISFNYLGRFEQELPGSIVLGEAAEPIGSDRSLIGQRRFVLEINGLLRDGQLQFTWTYSRNLHSRGAIEELAQSYGAELEHITKCCCIEDVGGYTASDFPLAVMADPTLALLFRRWGRNVEDAYRLSPLQQGMLFHSMYETGAGTYVIQMSFRVEGMFQPDAFHRAWQRLLDRHPSLRTAFLSDIAPDPVQVVLRQVALPWHELDWRGDATSHAGLPELLRTDRIQEFALDAAPLMRCTLIRLDEQAWQFVWTHHHLLTDGWCLPILMREVLHWYITFAGHQDAGLPSPPPYRGYIAWLAQQDMALAETFWREALRGFHARTELAVGHPPARSVANIVELLRPEPTPTYQEVTTSLTASVSQALRRLAQTWHVTLNVLIHGAWAALLSRYSGETDVVFGATVSGRPPEIPDVESMVGLFITTLPVRVILDNRQTLPDFFASLQDAQVTRDAYSYTPLVAIHGWSELPPREPLFDSLVVFENYPMDDSLNEQAGAITVENVQLFEQTTFPLTLTAAVAPRIPLRLAYDVARFEHTTIERMLGNLVNLLSGLVVEPRQTLGTWATKALPGDAERQHLLVELNRGGTSHPRPGKTLPELFETQVRRTPSRIAAVFADQQLSYQRLNRRANQLAHYLGAQGVGPGVLVAVYMDRSLEMLIAILGIQKAGGAYVPLDPTYPTERIAFMLADAQVRVVLTQSHLRHTLPETHAHVLSLDSRDDETCRYPSANPVRASYVDAIAYVLYTSGSTGKPKGVEITQRSLVNFLLSMADSPGLNADDVLLAVTTISFDIAGLELYLPLLTGARLELASREIASDGFRLKSELERIGASVMQATPATWRLLLAAGWQGAPLQRALCGGEGLPGELAVQMLDRGVELWNLYGPTETTVWSSLYPVVHHAHNEPYEPIGRPIASTHLYVADRQHHLAPMGVSGELLIGGDGLARGYLRRPGLTAERFIPDPFAAEPGNRLYRTGDLVRYHEDGNLMFHGRLDQQVKLRGFRIELGEIEAVLNRRREIGQAVVAIWDAGSDDTHLAAYVLPRPGHMLDDDTVRDWLRGNLPAYMIPTYIVFVDEFPLTPNGKLDRRALPAPHRRQQPRYVAPRTPTEQQLADIMADVLSVEQIGIHDDFFAHGGHSLLATKFVARVRQALQLAMPLPVLFQQPTVGQLASYIETTVWAAQQQRLTSESVLEEDEEEIRL